MNFVNFEKKYANFNICRVNNLLLLDEQKLYIYIYIGHHQSMSMHEVLNLITIKNNINILLLTKAKFTEQRSVFQVFV